ncbi:MAG: hypothetical protein Q9223_003099 [Gallowayella weberi]
MSVLSFGLSKFDPGCFICSLGQQLTITAFLSPHVPASARHQLFYPFLLAYSRVVYVSAPLHLTTLAFSLLNIFLCPAPLHSHGLHPSASLPERTLWIFALVLTVLHAYPLRLGLRLRRISQEQWDCMSEAEGRTLMELFVRVNGTRLAWVDIWGVMAVVGAVVVGIGALNG